MQTSVAGRGAKVVSIRPISVLEISREVRAGNEEACRGFVRKGVDLNQQYSILKWSALLEAAIYNKFRLIPILLEGGAHIDIQDTDRRTPLINAVINNSIEAVEILLRRGANVLIRDEHGCTALSYAKDPRIKDLIIERFRQMKKKPR